MNFKQPKPGLLSDGNLVPLNGTSYRLKILSGNDTRLFRSQHPRALLAERELQFENTMQVLTDLAHVVTRVNERLLDPLDGLTNVCVQALLEAQELSLEFKDAIRPWALALFKMGSNVHTERGCVLVPPLPRHAFQNAIECLPAQARGRLRWRDFLDHIFDPIPLITQGFYLFDRREDRLRFEEALGDDFVRIRKNLDRLFEDALLGGMIEKRWKLVDELSQQALSLQREMLETALERASRDVHGITTRVGVRCYEGGAIRFSSRPYCFEFSVELEQCARLLDQARHKLPAHVFGLRGVMADLVQWCRSSTNDPKWGESLPSWLDASDPDDVIDINLTMEEKTSRLGAKGGFQLVVSAFEQVPESIRPVLEKLQVSRENGPQINFLWLRQLLVGGSASNMTIAGEKLPDSDGRPLYKVMTFTNTVRASMVDANLESMGVATGVDTCDISRLGDRANLCVLLHELGHTFGDFSEFLGEVGGSVEETNAEASAIFLAHRMVPDALGDVILWIGCWTPVLRVMQGPTEPHSHSGIVLFDELSRVGGVVCVERESSMRVVPGNVDEAVRAAFSLAMRMRLWELGLPLSHQQPCLEPYDPSDKDQDQRIIMGARARLAQLEESEVRMMRDEVVRECRAFFAPARLQQLAQPLFPIIEGLVHTQSMTIIPTDERYSLVLEREPSALFS